MSKTGKDLINAIVKNSTLMGIDNCPGVPAQMSCAVYGSIQDDSGSGTVIKPGSGMQDSINKAVGFGGANSETAVWHFLTGSPVHHFVVVPWYQHESPQSWVYTVFMAYEDKYSLGEYVEGKAPAPATGGKGYKTVWTVSQLSTMLSDLLTRKEAWEEYFGKVGPAQATKLTYWKYKVKGLDAAVSNVEKYTKPCA